MVVYEYKMKNASVRLRYLGENALKDENKQRRGGNEQHEEAERSQYP